MAKVKAVCISEAKGTRKNEVPSINVVVNHGIVGDAHAGKWHRQISLLAKESIDKIGDLGVEITPGTFAENIVPKDSWYNNVDRNVQTMALSDYPDKEKGNLILASHSGPSDISYFRYLYLVSVGDTVSVKYNGKNYTYKIVSIYKENKDGAVRIKRDVNKTTITLITCSYNDKYHQTIYIGELVGVADE